MKESKEQIIKELKVLALDDFINSTYQESDRFQVSLHQVVDDWASRLSFNEGLEFLSQFEQKDFESLDSGLYDGVLEKEGFEKLVIVLAYCLAEQELYNDDLLNSLQNWESKSDTKSKQLINNARKELKALKN